eukprot:COSAG02_NODE_671_length_18661_cov_9.755953_1_plen_104_part_10
MVLTPCGQARVLFTLRTANEQREQFDLQLYLFKKARTGQKIAPIQPGHMGDRKFPSRARVEKDLGRLFRQNAGRFSQRCTTCAPWTSPLGRGGGCTREETHEME